MEACLHVAQFLTPQLNSKDHTCNAFTSIPSLRVNASRHRACITQVHGRRRGSALTHVTSALLNGDGGGVGHFEDEWYAMDASQLKPLLLQALKKWGLPVAVGAFVGSMIARQAFIFVTSFSFLVYIYAHNVVESQGGHVNSISDVFSRQFLQILLYASKSHFSRVSSSLPVVLTACSACLRRLCMHIHLLLTSTWMRLRSLVATKQGIESQHRDLSPLDIEPKVSHPAFDTEPKSIESIIHDINACIQKLESMAQLEKGAAPWEKLRDNLALLKAMVATVPLESKGRGVSSVDASMTLGSTVKGSGKSRRRNRKHLDGKMEANMVESLTASESQEGKQRGCDAVAKIEDDICRNAALLSGEEALHSMAPLALNAVDSNQEYGLFPRDFSNDGSSSSSKQHVEATLKMGESKNRISLSSNVPKPKHIDYWTQDSQNGSALPSGSFEQSKNWHNCTSAHQKDILVNAGDQITKGLQDFKEPKLYAGKKNFWSEETPLSDLMGDSDQAKVSSTRLNSGNIVVQNAGGQEEERHEPEKSLFASKSNKVDHSISLETSAAEPMSIIGEDTVCSNDATDYRYHDSVKAEHGETRRNQSENKWSPNKSIHEQSSAQQRASGSNGATHAVEPNITGLGSYKELSFVREDTDMHALTGFSRRINEEEFQRLMTEGEITFRNGKAGLLGKIEVGEAETMFYKAADLFASAAAMDSSSVEALGFWGNTLLVHGELKLMLSRELKHMIGTPDVISSYQIRRSRINEIHDNTNRAALQQTFQAVCEECEELLIQAGRKYRMVLSISKSEIRALYNWGLALCFRAQLIAEEGGQSARDAADKVYLAAIDKFEAIMGISRRYSPGGSYLLLC